MLMLHTEKRRAPKHNRGIMLKTKIYGYINTECQSKGSVKRVRKRDRILEHNGGQSETTPSKNQALQFTEEPYSENIS